MKIVRLTAENVKKLRAVEILPSGNVITISGKNAQGKTSVLDSIWWALAGTKNIQDQPIRKGETKARIRLDLGELVVERKFTANGSTLSVDTADGARFPSPQKMLDALLGELTFDPLAFARMDPRRQFDELRRVAKIEVDVDKLDALNRADYDDRTDVNREAKAKRAQAQGIAIPPAPAEAIDEGALVDELQRAGEHNGEIDARIERRKAAAAQAQSLRSSAAQKQERIDEIKAQIASLQTKIQALEKAAQEEIQHAVDLERKLADADAMPDRIDVAALRQRLDEAKRTNAAIAARTNAERRKGELEKAAQELEARSRELTEAIEARAAAKTAAIKAASMPVDGLGLGDGIVTYNGIPFEQCSSAEQLRVSMAIAMAANPKVRVIRITDGSLLDEDSMLEIAAMAGQNDFQVWVERVDSTGKLGIVIEDGTVVSSPDQTLAAATEA